MLDYLKPNGNSAYPSVDDMNHKRYIGMLAEHLTGAKPHEIHIISYEIDGDGRYSALIEHADGYRERIHEYSS